MIKFLNKAYLKQQVSNKRLEKKMHIYKPQN